MVPLEAFFSGDLQPCRWACDGAAISSLEEAGGLSQVVPYVTVWARTSPRQKESIVQHLRTAHGKAVLMCGDGTNDVGALKAAEVGVGLINVSALQASVPAINPKLTYAEQLQQQAEATLLSAPCTFLYHRARP